MSKIRPNSSTGMRGFFLWLRDANPALYAKAMPRVRSGHTLAGLGFTNTSAALPVDAQETGPAKPGVAQTISSILQTVASGYLTAQQVKNQQKVLDMQLQRAQQGLPPLDVDLRQYGMVPQASVGLTDDTQRLLLWVVAGVGAIVVVSKLIK